MYCCDNIRYVRFKHSEVVENVASFPSVIQFIRQSQRWESDQPME